MGFTNFKALVTSLVTFFVSLGGFLLCVAMDPAGNNWVWDGPGAASLLIAIFALAFVIGAAALCHRGDPHERFKLDI